VPPTGEDRQEPRKRGATAGSRVTWVAFGKAQLTAVFSASPSAMASSGDSSTTSRPPPSSGTRITMPRPSLVTSSGPSPVRGFIAAIRHPLSCLGAAGTSRGLRHPLRFPAGPASHNHVDQYLYYPEFRPAVLTISVPADASLSGECQARLGSGGEIGALTDHLRGSSGEGGAAPGPAETRGDACVPAPGAADLPGQASQASAPAAAASRSSSCTQTMCSATSTRSVSASRWELPSAARQEAIPE